MSFICSRKNCKKAFASRDDLQIHLNKAGHRGAGPKPAYCPNRHMNFGSSGDLVLHRRRPGRPSDKKGNKSLVLHHGGSVGGLSTSDLVSGMSGMNIGNSVSISSHKTTIIKKTLKPAVNTHTQRQRIYCSLMLDISGSMYGDRIAAAYDGIRNLLKVLRPKDRITIHVFNSSIKQIVFSKQPGDIDVKKLAADNPCTNGTALLDAVCMAASDATKNCNAGLPMMIVLTDGSDNSSSKSVSDAKSALRKAADAKGFRGILLSVGNDGDSCLRSISSKIKNCQVHNADASAAGVKSAFQFATKAVDSMVQVQKTTVITTGVHAVGNGGGGNVSTNVVKTTKTYVTGRGGRGKGRGRGRGRGNGRGRGRGKA